MQKGRERKRKWGAKRGQGPWVGEEEEEDLEGKAGRSSGRGEWGRMRNGE